MKIAIIKEGKIPIDRRVPLLPEQCVALMEKYPELSFMVQSSEARCVPDQEYLLADIPVRHDVSKCDIFLGIKEVPLDYLISNKTYFFFSHTTKGQAYNRKMLQTILRECITLIDYEYLTDQAGNRLVAFGRFAGIVGAYNAIRAFGDRYRLFQLKPAYQCKNMMEMQREYAKVKLPTIKIAVTGSGRVASGVCEVLEALRIKRVSAEDYLTKKFVGPAYTMLDSGKYYLPRDPTQPWNRLDFYQNPQKYQSGFLQYAQHTHLLITAHYWNPGAAPLFSREDIQRDNFKIRVIADITCDIEGSVPTTLCSSTVDNYTYDYNPRLHRIEEAYSDDKNITVMAIDNLPSELPWDASQSFGEQLSEHVFPALLGQDPNQLLSKATIVR
ncbi:MAG: alanine dehydrogenase, partial [Bacteroidia bacterium]|nr:alanine dehydrogenase [Bacteroidia bacterium]